ncbi:MAG: hypothetical protein P8N43_10695 [Alphaproteobacteria bacterium]|nr:hypothetical protein [Alphaproteobacteria bacterium]
MILPGEGVAGRAGDIAVAAIGAGFARAVEDTADEGFCVSFGGFAPLDWPSGVV